MSAQTSIEWTDRTWNPTRGCTRVSEGCRNCYAERMASRGFSWSKGFATSTPAGPRWTGKVALIPEALDEPLRWRKPQRIFVNSMSDLFHESLPNEAISKVFFVMGLAERHTFQILTKRPERMLSWCLGRRDYHASKGGWPLPNVWLGTSVEDQATADLRIPLLLQTPAAVRFISLEPQLAHVDLRPYVALLDVLCCQRCGFRTNRKGHGPCPNDGATLGPDVRLDWVIVGGESGPGARPFEIGWARSVVAQCKAAGTPAFVKQLGSRWARAQNVGRDASLQKLRNSKGGDPSEWEKDLRVREFPA